MKQELFLFCSRPLFRTCEIICNHTARLLSSSHKLSREGTRSTLVALNRQRVIHQGELERISLENPGACMGCKGHCCGGVRERDAFIDRILQDPDTPHVGSRRRVGWMPGADGESATADGQPVSRSCPELTTRGCRIPYTKRPIQCAVYFCRPLIKTLPPRDVACGMRAVFGLMSVQIRAASAML